MSHNYKYDTQNELEVSYLGPIEPLLSVDNTEYTIFSSLALRCQMLSNLTHLEVFFQSNVNELW